MTRTELGNLGERRLYSFIAEYKPILKFLSLTGVAPQDIATPGQRYELGFYRRFYARQCWQLTMRAHTVFTVDQCR